MKNAEATATGMVDTADTFAAVPAIDSDGELLRRFASSGDQSAFSQLVTRHAPMVLRMCRRMCDGDHAAAEDLAQSVFLDFASQAAALQTRTSVAGWLYRTSWHVSARYRRGRATRELHEREAAIVQPAAPGDRDDVPFAVLTSELSDALSKALASLPECHRDALVLHYFGGHTVGQTAEVLGVRVGTAASWLSRGADMLRAHLQRRGVTLASNVVEAWLGAEAARMVLDSPGEGALHALEYKVGAPSAAALVSAPSVLAGLAGSGGIGASSLLVGGGAFGLSRFATSALIGFLTVSGAGMAAASVLPGGLGRLNPFGGGGGSTTTGGSQIASAMPTPVSNPSSDSAAHSFTDYFTAGPGGSLPEPTGLALLGGAAAFGLRRSQRRGVAPSTI